MDNADLLGPVNPQLKRGHGIGTGIKLLVKIRDPKIPNAFGNFIVIFGFEPLVTVFG